MDDGCNEGFAFQGQYPEVSVASRSHLADEQMDLSLGHYSDLM